MSKIQSLRISNVEIIDVQPSYKESVWKRKNKDGIEEEIVTKYATVILKVPGIPQTVETSLDEIKFPKLVAIGGFYDCYLRAKSYQDDVKKYIQNYLSFELVVDK